MPNYPNLHNNGTTTVLSSSKVKMATFFTGSISTIRVQAVNIVHDYIVKDQTRSTKQNV